MLFTKQLIHILFPNSPNLLIINHHAPNTPFCTIHVKDTYFFMSLTLDPFISNLFLLHHLAHSWMPFSSPLLKVFLV